MDLRDLKIFLHTAQLGSLSASAKQLDLTPSAASAALKRLEYQLGSTLFLRSTRSLRLTEEGLIFLKYCEEALQLLSEGKQAISIENTNARGLIQISMPSDLGRNIILPLLDQFLEMEPTLQFKLFFSDRLVDIYRQPIDITLRYGTLPNSSFIALPVCPSNQRLLCASPDYVKRHGLPTKPNDLRKHNCLIFYVGNNLYNRWNFSVNKEPITVEVSGNRISDDGDAIRRWALSGHGIAYKSALDVAKDLASGCLVHVCPTWVGEHAPLHLLCARKYQVSPTIHRLQFFLAEQCSHLLHDIASN